MKHWGSDQRKRRGNAPEVGRGDSPLIHIFIGTKAQFIKTAPIIQELERRKIAYNLIDSGQHAEISQRLIQLFGLRQPDVYLRDSGQDIVSVWEAASWFIKWSARAIFNPQQVRRQLFKEEGGICLIHGDTLSTLLALLLAKRAKVKVAHIEAGLRSYNLLNPFPEEIIRLITMRWADILFSPSDWAHENIKRMKVKGKVINIGENTVVDSIRYALTQKTTATVPAAPYILVTIHRLETIYNSQRLSQITELLQKLSIDCQVLFVLHKPTKRQLEKFNLLKKLENTPNLTLLPMQDYFNFLQLLQGCRFAISDGGSIQEESYYLNIPCLVMREKTERMEGIGENVCLSEFDPQKTNYFLENYTQFKRKTVLANSKPSQLIVEQLVNPD